MNGELAEVIAVATHGTKWLNDQSGPPPALDASNSTFRYVRSVQFTAGRHTVREVAGWLRMLADDGVSRLWLAIDAVQKRRFAWLEPHMLAGLSGAGTWFVLATGAGRPHAWRPAWQVGNQHAPGQRIWDVIYRQTRATGGRQQRSLSETSASLRSAVTAAREFAFEDKLSQWTERFDRALANLDADAPQLPYHPDMVPPELPLEARRLVAAAADAWVFGGMGSWNDIGFASEADTKRHEALSRTLYAAVLNAFIAAVNVDVTTPTGADAS